MLLTANANGCRCPYTQSDQSLAWQCPFPQLVTPRHKGVISIDQLANGPALDENHGLRTPETFCLVLSPTSDQRMHQSSGSSELPMFPQITGKRPGFCLKDFLIQKNLSLEYLHVPILFTILTFILIMSLYQVSFRESYRATGT